jgi:hypothetical protein
MQSRELTEQQFKDETVASYMVQFSLTKEQAELAAQKEWTIRQEIEANPRFKKVKQKKKSTTAGFGQYRIKLSEKEHEQPKQFVSFSIDAKVRKELAKVDPLSVEDINRLFSGDESFLIEYARLVGFPEFDTKINGYKCWKVFEFIKPFKRVLKIDLRSKYCYPAGKRT